MARIMVVELDLLDNRPDIDTHIQKDNNVETDLGATTLIQVLFIEDEAETKATYTSEGGVSSYRL